MFSEKLNLNSFITVHGSENNETLEDRETVVKCDDCSTTDSGSADDESCQGTDVSSTVNGQDDNCADSDEGNQQIMYIFFIISSISLLSQLAFKVHNHDEMYIYIVF